MPRKKNRTNPMMLKIPSIGIDESRLIARIAVEKHMAKEEYGRINLKVMAKNPSLELINEWTVAQVEMQRCTVKLSQVIKSYLEGSNV